MKKYVRARHATDDNIIWYMHFLCRTNNATDTHSEYVVLIVIPHQQ